MRLRFSCSLSGDADAYDRETPPLDRLFLRLRLMRRCMRTMAVPQCGCSFQPLDAVGFHATALCVPLPSPLGSAGSAKLARRTAAGLLYQLPRNSSLLVFRYSWPLLQNMK